MAPAATAKVAQVASVAAIAGRPQRRASDAREARESRAAEDAANVAALLHTHAGEDAVVECIEAILDGIAWRAHEADLDAAALTFAAVDMTRQLWQVCTMVDAAPLDAGEAAAEAEPAAGAVDAWARRALPTAAARPQTAPPRAGTAGQAAPKRSAYNPAARPRTAARSSDSARPGDAARSDSRPASARPSSATRLIEVLRKTSAVAALSGDAARREADEARRELGVDACFQRADVRREGLLKPEELLAWLLLQAPVSGQELKKALEAAGATSTSNVDRKSFGAVLRALQSAAPTKWAGERLAVYSLPRAAPDRAAAARAAELEAILNYVADDITTTTTKHPGIKLPLDAAFTNNLPKAIDAPLHFAAAFAVTSPHVASPAPVKDLKVSKKKRAVRAAPRTLKHSASAPETPYILEKYFLQRSLVNDYEFVPQAGVAAREPNPAFLKLQRGAFNHASQSNMASLQGPAVDATMARRGPPWPKDPKRMSRQAFAELRDAKPEPAPTRAATAPGQRDDVSVSTPGSGSPLPDRRRLRPRESLRSIGDGRQGSSSRRAGNRVVTASEYLAVELLDFKPRAFGLTAPLDSPAFSGAQRPDIEPMTTMDFGASGDVEAFELLQTLERETIRELRGDEARRGMTAPISSPQRPHQNSVKQLRQRAPSGGTNFHKV